MNYIKINQNRTGILLSDGREGQYNIYWTRLIWRMAHGFFLSRSDKFAISFPEYCLEPKRKIGGVIVLFSGNEENLSLFSDVLAKSKPGDACSIGNPRKAPDAGAYPHHSYTRARQPRSQRMSEGAFQLAKSNFEKLPSIKMKSATNGFEFVLAVKKEDCGLGWRSELLTDSFGLSGLTDPVPLPDID